MSKQQKTKKATKKEKATVEPENDKNETVEPGFPKNLDFKRFLGCGG